MEKDYESIFSQLNKNKEVDIAMITKVKDPNLFCKFLQNKQLGQKGWNKLLVILFIQYFLSTKLSLHKSQREDVFEEICNFLISIKFEVPQLSEKENSQWIQIYNKILAHYMKLISQTYNNTQIEKYLKLISGAIAKADRINVLDSSLFVAKGRVWSCIH